MRRARTLLGTALLLTNCFTVAKAAENSNTQYAPGASQFYAGAIPPFEGFYFLSQTSYFSANRVNDGKGREIPIDFKVKASVETLRFMYVSDIRIGDAQLWGQLVLPLIHLDISNTFARDSGFNLGDATATFGLSWHPDHNQTFITGIDIGIPTGAYDENALANAGLNHWSVQPTIAYHYSDPQGLEFATAARVIFNSENTATDYKTGNEFVLDYAVGWNFGKIRVGATGYYIKQFTDDKGPGVASDGHRGEGLAIGPSLTYNFNPGLGISASWQHDVVAKNRSEGNTLWVNLATKF
ncbi:SphA family protein [Agrobacterium vitis]|uniref:Phenol degradation protein meta n=1 Tax=Agrobacterium vitis TaxID=373 RepID=A0A7K1R9R9_AGRVI|nr:transporter [Agrobacterium vitis]MVA54900.1 hypothetical protein [Agrobacterium vitis]